ncbi:glycosyltransferase family 2 protein [Microgenomates group bacterium]|nr:glycosyltransferase family 2 protein [Microgenomates group bacterium]
MDKIATIIVHYNTPEDTNNALESLSKIRTSGFKHQVYLVDNGSVEVFVPQKKYPELNLVVIRSDTNLGFTGGNNLGFARAREDFSPDFYFLLNSDTLIDRDCLCHLHKHARKNPSTGLISPLIYFAAGKEFHHESYTKKQLGTVVWYAGGTIDWANLSGFHQGVNEVDRGQFMIEKTKELDFATACAVLMRREIYELTGGFDDKFFLYYEDIDLSVRTKRAGYTINFCPEARIWHVNGGSGGGSGSQLQNYYLTRNRLLFFWRHGRKKIKITTLRLAMKYLFNGQNKVTQTAARHFFWGNFGKQVYLKNT